MGLEQFRIFGSFFGSARLALFKRVTNRVGKHAPRCAREGKQVSGGYNTGTIFGEKMLCALFWRCARYTYGLLIGVMEVTKLRQFMVWRFIFFLRCARYNYWLYLGCTQVQPATKKRGCARSRAGTILDRYLGRRLLTTRDATAFYGNRVARRYNFRPVPRYSFSYYPQLNRSRNKFRLRAGTTYM